MHISPQKAHKRDNFQLKFLSSTTKISIYIEIPKILGLFLSRFCVTHFPVNVLITF